MVLKCVGWTRWSLVGGPVIVRNVECNTTLATPYKLVFGIVRFYSYGLIFSDSISYYSNCGVVKFCALQCDKVK